MTRHLRWAAAILACTGTMAIAGSASGIAVASTHSRSALVVRHNATAHPASIVGFVAHAGAALFVFDHWIYQPFKAGDLTHGFTHKLAIAKAVLAALFVYHEMSVAINDVKGTKLAFLATPIAALESKFSSLKSQLTGGNTSAITGLNSGLASLGAQSAAKGSPIKEIVTSLT